MKLERLRSDEVTLVQRLLPASQVRSERTSRSGTWRVVGNHIGGSLGLVLVVGVADLEAVLMRMPDEHAGDGVCKALKDLVDLVAGLTDRVASSKWHVSNCTNCGVSKRGERV